MTEPRNATPPSVVDASLPPAAIRIDQALYSAMVTHLRAAAPAEGVGLLAVAATPGRDGMHQAVRFFPGTNVDASPTRYTMDGREVLAALQEIEARRWRLGAVVHSHPATPPVPSITDQREAHYPAALLVIVGLASEPPRVQAWRLGRGPGQFNEASFIVDAAGKPDSRPADRSAGGGEDDANDARHHDQAGSASPGPTRVTVALRPPQDLLTALAQFPDELLRAISGQSDEALVRPASDGGWGVVENLAHLRDWEEIFLDRAHAILDQERPHLPAFDDELWAIERDYRGQDPHQTAEQFRDIRTHLVELLETQPAEAWTRTGDHGLYGEITLHWMANHICDHDEEHLKQIREALA